jgi:hypothetical protein
MRQALEMDGPPETQLAKGCFMTAALSALCWQATGQGP